jgi:hypothetical protein
LGVGRREGRLTGYGALFWAGLVVGFHLTTKADKKSTIGYFTEQLEATPLRNCEKREVDELQLNWLSSNWYEGRIKMLSLRANSQALEVAVIPRNGGSRVSKIEDKQKSTLPTGKKSNETIENSRSLCDSVNSFDSKCWHRFGTIFHQRWQVGESTKPRVDVT